MTSNDKRALWASLAAVLFVYAMVATALLGCYGALLGFCILEFAAVFEMITNYRHSDGRRLGEKKR